MFVPDALQHVSVGRHLTLLGYQDQCLHSEYLLSFGIANFKALIEVEVGECQIKVSITTEQFSILLTLSS